MSIKVKPYQSYFGGKESNGTYQTIINLIPPHETFCSLFLGNCAITRHIKPAKNGLLNDIDLAVYHAWEKIDLIGRPGPYENYILGCGSALSYLNNFKDDPDPKTFIYLDPPYLKTSRKSQVDVYRYEMGDPLGHIALLELITRMPGIMIMISCYPNELYESYLHEWNHKDFYSTIRGGVALERVYYNYEFTGELHDNRYFGGNFREREQVKRIKNSLLKKMKQLPDSIRDDVVRDFIKELSSLSGK